MHSKQFCERLLWNRCDIREIVDLRIPSLLPIFPLKALFNEFSEQPSKRV